jgi:hypothetical protein
MSGIVTPPTLFFWVRVHFFFDKWNSKSYGDMRMLSINVMCQMGKKTLYVTYQIIYTPDGWLDFYKREYKNLRKNMEILIFWNRKNEEINSLSKCV